MDVNHVSESLGQKLQYILEKERIRSNINALNTAPVQQNPTASVKESVSNKGKPNYGMSIVIALIIACCLIMGYLMII